MALSFTHLFYAVVAREATTLNIIILLIVFVKIFSMKKKTSRISKDVFLANLLNILTHFYYSVLAV